jgi:nucleoside-diphosphate-sugar epimerase
MRSLYGQVAFVLAPLLVCSDAFEFTMPWDAMPKSPSGGGKALQPGDTVAVVGASGNVGKLVALRLSDSYKVNGIVRDASSVESFLDKDCVKLYEADLLEDLKAVNGDITKCPPSLRPALERANSIVICTGTTAFPTKAWTKSGETGIAGDIWKALSENSFNVQKAIASLDEQGFNTPNNIDAQSNQFIVNAWKDVCKVPRKRVIMLSSIGVQRRDQGPFPILNACGVLDAKAKGEAAIEQAAKDGGYSYTIIRPGQLFGGPYDNNYYLGTLFQLDKDTKTQDVEVAPGDTLVGDTLRSTLAEVTAQICEGDCARDLDFAVVNVKGEVPTTDQVQERLKAL